MTLGVPSHDNMSIIPDGYIIERKKKQDTDGTLGPAFFVLCTYHVKLGWFAQPLQKMSGTGFHGSTSRLCRP